MRGSSFVSRPVPSLPATQPVQPFTNADETGDFPQPDRPDQDAATDTKDRS